MLPFEGRTSASDVSRRYPMCPERATRHRVGCSAIPTPSRRVGSGALLIARLFRTRPIVFVNSSENSSRTQRHAPLAVRPTYLLSRGAPFIEVYTRLRRYPMQCEPHESERVTPRRHHLALSPERDRQSMSFFAVVRKDSGNSLGIHWAQLIFTLVRQADDWENQKVIEIREELS
jgi:hypothetical protein